MADVYMRISHGDDTTAIMGDVLEEIKQSDRDTFDKLEVDWDPPESPGIAGEPISAGIMLAGSAMIIAAVLRVIERRMEHIQQREILREVIKGIEKNPDATAELNDLAKKFSDVSISFGLVKGVWPRPPS